MTLDTVPAYDADRVSNVGDHAVVVGASMAGLLSARILADGYESVTILERDRLPASPEVRRGVQQARHIHALHEAGRSTLEALFPGYSERLVDAGAEVIDIATDFAFYDEGDFVADGRERLPMYCASRPLFEYVTRQRVAGTDGVSVRDECQVVEYLTDERAGEVRGVRVRAGDDGTETIQADLVVDTTGRTSRTPTWLVEHGYEAPPLDEVDIDLAYSTVYLDRPADDRRAFFVMPCPPRTRGAGMLPVEDRRWVLTCFGVHGDHPPTDRDGLVDFVATLPVEELSTLLTERSIRSADVAHYPFPSNRRRRYWELDQFPDGFLVLGDAVASFNPIYGQGMSVAALEALQVHHALANGGRDGLAVRVYDRIEPVVEDAWKLAVSADFRFRATSGPKPTGTDLLNRYLGRLTRKAHDDAVLADAYSRVVTMERRPTSLLRPGVAWRVLKPSA